MKSRTTKQEVKEYFERHQIYQLLEQISSDLAVNQPPDPRRYIHAAIGKMLGLEAQGDGFEGRDKTSSLRVYAECNYLNRKNVFQFFKSVPHIECHIKLFRLWAEQAISEIAKMAKQSMEEHSKGLDIEDPKFELDETEKQHSDLLRQIQMLTVERDKLRQDFARVMCTQMHAIHESGQKSRREERKSFDFCFGPVHAPPPPPLVSQPSQIKDLSASSDSCDLRIIALSDVSEIECMSHLDGLIRAHLRTNTVTIMAGNFLAPSLLSSLDMGSSLVDMMNRVGPHGIQLACLGNREANIPTADLSKRIQEFQVCSHISYARDHWKLGIRKKGLGKIDIHVLYQISI